MRIQEIMSRSVQLTAPDTTIGEAARKMRDEGVGALPVGENDRLIGMVTDRDIVIRGVADGRDRASVRDVMSKGIIYCYEDDDIAKAAESMSRHQVRRLPVINRDKRLVGVIALADLGRKSSEQAKTALGAISQPDGGKQH